MQSFVAISSVSDGTAQRRRISGETRARRQTFAPQGHSRKSLKAENLSDTRRSGDLFTNRRPRQHLAQVETHRGSTSKEMSFLLVIQSTKRFIFSPPGRMRNYRFFFSLIRSRTRGPPSLHFSSDLIHLQPVERRNQLQSNFVLFIVNRIGAFRGLGRMRQLR
ncbi:hypothetical protein ATANTOWER_029981 [Ataeniobius toweri]|uniref:Uncharacterized protein n=1 Tax=Ataeniobius toweri TaxID=208326 RepID=A0ABU7C181_9TELE|nr:hypothetical protein [Ataeniobius toweri]